MNDMKLRGSSAGARVQLPQDPGAARSPEQKQRLSDNLDVRAIRDGWSAFQAPDEGGDIEGKKQVPK